MILSNKQAGVGFGACNDDEAFGDEERDRCSIYLCQKLIIHTMNNVGRVRLSDRQAGEGRGYGAFALCYLSLEYVILYLSCVPM